MSAGKPTASCGKTNCSLRENQLFPAGDMRVKGNAGFLRVEPLRKINPCVLNTYVASEARNAVKILKMKTDFSVDFELLVEKQSMNIQIIT